MVAWYNNLLLLNAALLWSWLLLYAAWYAVLLEAGGNYGLLGLDFLLWPVTYGLHAGPCLGLPLFVGVLLCCHVGALFAWFG
jgi:hypothetical protein